MGLFETCTSNTLKNSRCTGHATYSHMRKFNITCVYNSRCKASDEKLQKKWRMRKKRFFFFFFLRLIRNSFRWRCVWKNYSALLHASYVVLNVCMFQHTTATTPLLRLSHETILRVVCVSDNMCLSKNTFNFSYHWWDIWSSSREPSVCQGSNVLATISPAHVCTNTHRNKKLSSGAAATPLMPQKE